jgi:hypothetical protein
VGFGTFALRWEIVSGSIGGKSNGAVEHVFIKTTEVIIREYGSFLDDYVW